jgi:hypothetical protein
MADLLCPHCGMPNPPEQNVCSFCRQPLRGPEDSQPIRPGEMPTKKITGELESVLPEWLRDARESGRRSKAENAAEEAQTESEKPAPPAAAPDFLAGLESASHEEQDDEIPEWMRGAAPISAPATPEKNEKTFPRRQEIRWDEDETDEKMGGMATTPIPSAPESGDAMLPWMRATQGEPAEEKDDVSSWFAERTPDPQEQTPISPFSTGSIKPPGTGELTDWLDRATTESVSEETPAIESEDSIGDWLSNVPRAETPSTSPASGESFGEDIDLPSWMQPAAEPSAPRKGEKKDDAFLPNWVNSVAGSSAAPQKKADEPAEPDWMSAFREQERSVEESAPITESAPEVPRAPAFVSGGGTAGGSQADELFSIEMPDWLSNIAPTEQKSASTGKAASQAEVSQESISPAELPSWVQAMRPVETALPGAETSFSSAEGPLEDKGPLAGLRGVLPLMGGLIQPGKPKAHAIRLQVSDAQHADASLLEQMLAAETQAKPLRGGGTLASQRVLRWVISALLILLVAFFLLTGSQSVPLPAAPLEESSRIASVLISLPDDAPVLMVFDYEPALAGELEAAAAPFVDRVLGFRHPRVTILSTSPTGGALAERFFRNTQAQHNYQPEQNYINLGYLPGGTIGILSFAENPRAAMPSLLWDSVVAQGVNGFSDYAVVILLTDQAETARAWVEQTAGYRESHPLLVISSAQAGPMIQPYLVSGQVNGLVNGLHDGAAFESSTGDGSPVRRYWDAYNFATLFAALLIILGGLWNFFAGVRSRRQGLDEV